MPTDTASIRPRTVSRSVDVAAPPGRVWDLVSDLPGMGAFSPENTGGAWVGGATGPALGAVFVGRNASGRRRWSTRCTVTRCEPGRAFGFEVRAAALPIVALAIADWSFGIEPTASGCRLTETWQDRRGRTMTLLGSALTGVRDRATFTRTSLDQTLQAVRRAAEQS